MGIQRAPAAAVAAPGPASRLNTFPDRESIRVCADNLAAGTARQCRVDRDCPAGCATPKMPLLKVSSLGAPLAPYVQVDTVSLRNRTEPSSMAKFDPPGWKLPAERTTSSP